MKKFNNGYKDIITLENLLVAWGQFLKGKRRRHDVTTFQTKLMENILGLHRDIANKNYIHGEYYSFNISDPKPRNIHKATVRDRLLHHLLYQELYTYFDAHFIYDSYSCRINKGTHKAIDRFKEFSRKVSRNNTKACWVLKCDVRKFFASIDHAVLKEILAQHISDQDILYLLGQTIDSFRSPEDKATGLPLGNLTSQLLVNIYMNEFDHFMKQILKVKYYIRYADDFVIVSNDRSYLENLIIPIVGFLKGKLKLSLHRDKVFLQTLTSGIDFLGWVHFPHHRIPRTSTKRRMLKRIKEFPTSETLTSYWGLLKHGSTYNLTRRIRNDLYSLL